MDTSSIETSIIAMEKKAFAERIARIYSGQSRFFESGETRSLAFRRKQLEKLKKIIRENESLLVDALAKDLKKPEFESYGTEIGQVYEEINYVLKNLRSWLQPVQAPTPLTFFPSRSKIFRDPLGIVLVIGPWNYPFLLLFSPIISAIAGGNTVILKPSEYSPHTSDIISKLIEDNFDESFISVIQADGQLVGSELISKYHLDHIFFTGSTRVGKIIMEQASRHLSPVTLELGGKSPCIVDQNVNLDFAARKIAWSKMINAGQTCVAPDYLLVHESVKTRLLGKIENYWQNWLGRDPQLSPDFGRMVNPDQFRRQEEMLDNGKIVYGGQRDPESGFVAPTILDDVEVTEAIMKEEIFGPLLPVIVYQDKQEVLDWINKNPYPLSLYIYTSDRKTADFYIQKIRFGGGCVNNGIIHLGNPDIPFGGVGYSGIGQYHGRYGFETFTRMKSVMYTPTWFDVPLWYPPYRNKVKWLRKFFMRH